MGLIRQSRTIRASAEAIWHALNDIDNTPKWVEGLADAELKTSGPIGAGSVYIDYNRIGPFRQVTPWVITVFEPMSRQVHVSASRVLPTTMTLNLAPAAEGIWFEMVVEYRFLPMLGAIGRLLEKILVNGLIRQMLSKNQANLEAYLRQQETSPASRFKVA